MVHNQVKSLSMDKKYTVFFLGRRIAGENAKFLPSFKALLVSMMGVKAYNKMVQRSEYVTAGYILRKMKNNPHNDIYQLLKSHGFKVG